MAEGGVGYVGSKLMEELLLYDDADGAIENEEPFDCDICIERIQSKKGIVLRECLHMFCKSCIKEYVKNDVNVEMKCPNAQCEFTMQDREVRDVVTIMEFDQYKMKGLRAAQTTMKGSVQCSKPDCGGWCICEVTVNDFDCEVCGQKNCIPCRVSIDTFIHSASEHYAILSNFCLFIIIIF